MARPPAGYIPSLRLHKQSGRGIVTLNGRDHLMPGKFGAPECVAAYHSLIARWIENGRRPINPPRPVGVASVIVPPEFTVDRLCEAHETHAEAYYRRADGTPTTEPRNLRHACKLLRAAFGSTPAKVFSPAMLEQARDRMIGAGRTRKAINRDVKRIVSVFKWGVSKQLIDADVYTRLSTVAPLKRGRSKAAESQPVKPIDRGNVEAAMPFMPPPVRALVDLQLATGARPGELLNLRAIDIDRSGPIWKFEPAGHKNAHREQSRVIMFGPAAQEIIGRFLVAGRDLTKPLFCPREGNAAARAENAKGSRRPGQKPNRRRGKKIIGRTIGDAYTLASYRRAIARACDEADAHARAEYERQGGTLRPDERLVERFHPHQLRHTVATAVRERYGVEAAQAALGHATLSATQVYAEKSLKLAAKVAAEVG